MAYDTPADPVAGTVITVAYAVSNLLGPIRWLRLLTGNADPPGSSYVVVSDSTNGTAWRKIPADALAVGVVLANLGYTPVNKIGDIMTGTLTVLKTQGVTSSAFSTAQLVAQSLDAAANPAESAGIGFHRTNASGLYLYHDGSWLKMITNAGAMATLLHSASTGQIVTALLADGAVTSVKIADGAVDAAKLGLSAVVTTRIADQSVTGAKILNGDIGTLQLANGSVTSAKIADGTIGTIDIADGAITSAKILDGAITSAKIADGTITDVDVAAANTDGLAATASLRTLGAGAQQAAAGNHGHTDLLAKFGNATIGANTWTTAGTLTISGAFAVTGSKTRLATGADGEQGFFHGVESPSPYFEDYGRARLQSGRAAVEIPADFANYVKLTAGEYYVTLTAEGRAALYVAERTDTHFAVELLTGDTDAGFIWRITARQVDLPETRLQAAR